MAVAQPEILFVMAEASGSTVGNDGTLADVTVSNGSETTNWTRNVGGPYVGYWRSLTQGGASQAAISMTGLTLATSMTSRWAAMAFNLTSYHTSGSQRGYLLGRSAGGELDGGIFFRAQAPAGGGDFDLLCGVRATNSSGPNHTFSALSFLTDYALCISIDTSTVSACQGKFLLDSGTIQKPATVDMNTLVFDNNGGYIGRAGGFANYYGFVGNVYYFAQGVALLSDQDMEDINDDPAATIGGWPGGGGGAVLLPMLMQHFA